MGESLESILLQKAVEYESETMKQLHRFFHLRTGGKNLSENYA